MTVAALRRLCVYTRHPCPLCDDFLLELRAFLDGRDPAGVALEIRDVDADPVAQRRYGIKVPVLLLDDEPVAHGRFDAAGLGRLLDR